MTIWLEEVLSELSGVTEAQVNLSEPADEPSPKDHVVGIASPKLRNLYFVWRQNRKYFLELAAGLELCGQKERGEKIREARRFYHQSETLKNSFWICARNSFPELWDKPSVDVRRGWKVVWTDPEEHTLGRIIGALIDTADIEEILRDGVGPSEGRPGKRHLDS